MGRKKLDIMVKNGRSDLSRLGLFSETQYITIGDEYNSKKHASFLDYRTKGKQFVTAPIKHGKDSRDAYFDKEFLRSFETEPHTDIVLLRRRWRAQAKEKNITSSPFKPSSVPPKPSGKGSVWGTIQQQWPLPPSGFTEPPRKPEEPKKIVKEPKNFLTAPPKKGSGYGYPGVTIGKGYTYESDPYGRSELIARDEHAEHKKKIIGDRPFISASPIKECFGEFTTLSTTEGNTAADNANAKLSNSKLPPLTPFKPTSCCGSTINPYPKYEPPSGHGGDSKSYLNRDSHHGIFKPAGVTGSYPIRSIVETSCPIAPPKWIQESLKTALTETSTAGPVSGR